MSLAVGTGFDVKLGPSMYLNFDLRKVQIRSEVLAGGAKLSSIKRDPWLMGTGLGWRF